MDIDMQPPNNYKIRRKVLYYELDSQLSISGRYKEKITSNRTYFGSNRNQSSEIVFINISIQN